VDEQTTGNMVDGDSEGSYEPRKGEYVATHPRSPILHRRLQYNIAGNPRAEGFLGGTSPVRWMEDVGRVVADLER
jgi:hypothetical protein